MTRWTPEASGGYERSSAENANLKKLLAEAALGIEVLKEINEKW